LEESTIRSNLEEARNAEATDMSLAIGRYKDVLKKDPLNQNAYNRLMLLYRRQKDYQNELRIIKQGLSEFRKFYKAGKTGSKKIAELSKKLNLSVGLTDKKGNNVYEPEPIPKWEKRKLVVEKRAAKKIIKKPAKKSRLKAV